MTALDFDGPSGERVTPSHLPAIGRKNLSDQEKALVVAAVRNGMLTFFEACTRYNLNLDEFLAWHRLFNQVWYL
jgi:hypothetical protein